MKRLTLYLHAAVQGDVVDALRATDEVTGFTVSSCQGHSRDTDRDPFLATRDRVVGFVPRVRIEVVLPDEDVQTVLDRVTGCLPGEGGAGAWIVDPVEGFGRL